MSTFPTHPTFSDELIVTTINDRIPFENFSEVNNDNFDAVKEKYEGSNGLDNDVVLLQTYVDEVEDQQRSTDYTYTQSGRIRTFTSDNKSSMSMLTFIKEYFEEMIDGYTPDDFHELVIPDGTADLAKSDKVDTTGQTHLFATEEEKEHWNEEFVGIEDDKIKKYVGGVATDITSDIKTGPLQFKGSETNEDLYFYSLPYIYFTQGTTINKANFVVIPASERKDYNVSYQYKYEINFGWNIEDFLPTIYFDKAESCQFNYSPNCMTSGTKLIFWARKIPEDNFLIPLIKLERSYVTLPMGG